MPTGHADLRTFGPTFLLFFFIAAVYNLLRPLKISLVVGAPNSGAEVIPYLKVWGVLPAALVFTLLFTSLNKYMDRERVFYWISSCFIAFFALFAFVLFPYSDLITLDSLGAMLTSALPEGFTGLIAMIQYWHLSLFYVFAELWGSVVLSMLFWGFVNENTTFTRAKRSYAMFALGANIASIAAGQVSFWLTKGPLIDLPGVTPWQISVYSILALTLLSCAAIVVLFRILVSRQTTVAQDGAQPKPKNVSFTFRECVREMIRNPYLRYLALIVLSYNWVFNLTDVVWTDRLRLLFASSLQDLNAYVSQVTMAKGLLATLIALGISFLPQLSWRQVALMTPMMLMGTAGLFFPLALIGDSRMADMIATALGCPVLQLTVFIGALQNSLTRACKYTAFDASKEMAYIPLTTAEKRQGKAVIDGIGSRLGKSIGSITFQVLLPICGSLAATTPYIALLVGVISAIWIYSVFKLSMLIRPQPSATKNPSSLRAPA